MKPTSAEIQRELDHIKRCRVLTPQEHALLERIVSLTIKGETGRLYQKALAEDLQIASPRQIGVIATRVRAKLNRHSCQHQRRLAVRIELPDRGYEAQFSFRDLARDLSDRSRALLANAKAALDHRTVPGAATALSYLGKALEHDPDHPLLLSMKAYCHATRAVFGTVPRADLQAADAILDQTRSATPRCWESWFAEACVAMALRWDWAGAKTAFDKAIALNGEAQRQPWYCAFLASQGSAADAIPLLQLTVNRSHDSPIARADLVAAEIWAGRYDAAAATIRTTMHLFGARAHYLMWVYQAILEEATGNPQRAVATLAQVPLRWPQTSITLGLRAYFSGLNGDVRTARRHLLKLKTARSVAGKFVPSAQLSAAAFGAGDHQQGVDWLRRGALDERDPNLVLANVYPFFRHLHRHPGFRAVVVDTMGLRLPA